MDADPLERIGVRILLPEVEPGSRRSDRVGWVAATLELGLADLPGVIPQVAGHPIAPGLPSGANAPLAAEWNLELSVELSADTEIGASLCVDSTCTELPGHRSVGLDDPTKAVAELLVDVGLHLDRLPPAAVRDSWSRRGTSDDYANLLAGRSAAVFYGLREAPSTIGDRKADPVARAFYLDPGMPIAAWMAARSPGRVSPTIAFRRAVAARPESLVLQAGLASTFADARVSRPIYDDLLQRAPLDGRFSIDIAQNRLQTGRLDDAAAVLDAMGIGAGRIPAVAALRVGIADAAGECGVAEPGTTRRGGTCVDDLLERWRQADPIDPVPVRRLVRNRVLRADYEGALALLDDLRARGEDTRPLELALLYALGRTSEAAALAEPTDPELASRIRSAPRDPEPGSLDRPPHW